LKIKFSNYLLVAVLRAMLAVRRGRSLKEKLSNYLLVAVLQAMLAVCRGIKMYHFFVEESRINENRIYVDGADYNHIRNVIRLKNGDEVMISVRNTQISDAVRNFMCGLSEYTDNEVVFDIIDRDVSDTELPCQVILYQGLPKSDKLELIIQKAVELGVSQIVPVAMKRSVVKLDDKKAAAKLPRWNAISESAAKQSKRSLIPEVRPVMSYALAVREAAGCDICFVPYENENGMAETRRLVSSITPGNRVAVFIGPEGGFEDDEIEAARKLGMHTITLGKRILRTETAGLSFLSMLAYALEN